LFAMLAAVFVPWLGELAGILPATFTFHDGGILIHTPDLGGGATLRVITWVAFSTLVVATATVIAYVVRRTEGESRRRLHLQAWHLRQLVP
jgi:hypothetical protein